MFWGYLLIIIGLIILLKNLGLFTETIWEIIYPATIILFGLMIILRKRKNKNQSINFE